MSVSRLPPVRQPNRPRWRTSGRSLRSPTVRSLRDKPVDDARQRSQVPETGGSKSAGLLRG